MQFGGGWGGWWAGVFRLKAQTRVILETDDVGVFQFAEVFDVRLFLLSDLLDGNFF